MSRRPGLGRHPLHRQHHPPGPATDQDRAGLHPGVVGVLHAVPGRGAGVWRLRDEPAPERRELAEIALQSADSAAAFGITPRVAMISYSSGESASGEEVEKVREATLLAHEQQNSLLIDGPLQYDAAANETVARQLAPNSQVAGRATVFVFPT
jgi:hypothetical protein